MRKQMLRKKRTAPCPYPIQGNLDGPVPRRSFSRQDAGVSPEHRERCSGSQAFFRESPWRGSHGNSSFPLILATQLHLPFGVFFCPGRRRKIPFREDCSPEMEMLCLVARKCSSRPLHLFLFVVTVVPRREKKRDGRFRLRRSEMAEHVNYDGIVKLTMQITSSLYHVAPAWGRRCFNSLAYIWPIFRLHYQTSFQRQQMTMFPCHQFARDFSQTASVYQLCRAAFFRVLPAPAGRAICDSPGQSPGFRAWSPIR